MMFLDGEIYIDWSAADREIKRQLVEGVINIDKIVAVVAATAVPRVRTSP